MSVDRNKIVKFCEDYLQVKKFADYCLDGLQVEGTPKVTLVITGVSLSNKLIGEAIKKKAQMIIVHHGLFGKQIGSPPQIKGYIAARLKLIMANNINLAGFHLPLDAHAVIGNNISLAKLFGLKNIRPLDTPDHGAIGYLGDFNKIKTFKEFTVEVDAKLNTKSYILPFGPRIIKRLGIVSGGASPDFKMAAEMGADTFLCGDIREEIIEAVRETKINFINAGHYNTEKLGIRNLGNLIAKKFKVKVEFVDIPCEV